ncbi:YggT family protein [Bacteriovoracales bacterium]|nr:YggT family protein [Bacteriovoracales bacterium]
MLVRLIVEAYIMVILADVVLSYLPQFNNAEWRVFIKKLADYTCKPIRSFMPQDMPFDLSPLVVMVLLQMVSSLF